MSTFSGSIQVKKKAELQEIAAALTLPDTGTREELLTRIKRYIDEHTAELEDDPRFSGLVSSRKRQRSVQPSAPPSTIGSSGTTTARVVVTSSRVNMASIKEADEDDREPTLVAHDLNDVSMMIPSTMATPHPKRTTTGAETLATPSSLPPLPPSPARSILADALTAPEVQAVVEMERSAVRSVKNTLIQTRALLSDATTLYVLTALLDLTGIMFTIHRDNIFPLPSVRETPLPSLVATALTVVHWSLPAVIFPLIAGHLVSFAPQRSASVPVGSLTFDPLTASIIRVASTLAYQIPHIRITTTKDTINVQHLLGSSAAGSSGQVHSLDVLSSDWRLFTSILALAFATAEGLGRAGVSVSKLTNRSASREGTPTPSRT